MIGDYHYSSYAFVALWWLCVLLTAAAVVITKDWDDE